MKAHPDGLVIGIDPGKKGGIVALDLQGFPVEWLAADHPSDGYCRGKGRQGVYLVRDMAEWLRDRMEGGRVALVVIETQQVRSAQAGGLTIGMGWGLWLGIVGTLGLPLERVNPQRWQRDLWGKRKPGADTKTASIDYVRTRGPALPLKWKRRTNDHDGLSDAACLALWGLKQLARGAT